MFAGGVRRSAAGMDVVGQGQVVVVDLLGIDVVIVHEVVAHLLLRHEPQVTQVALMNAHVRPFRQPCADDMSARTALVWLREAPGSGPTGKATGHSSVAPTVA